MSSINTDDLVYDTVLMRDTCGNSRSKIKNYFYHRIYDSDNFQYTSDYDELILLDYLEGTKQKKDYLKTIIPFLIIMCLGGLSIILWCFLCYCFKSPKGCLKRYSKANKKTRDICFFIFFGFCSVILILIIVTVVYLTYSKSDINGAICTLSMLRYEIVYGQSLLEKKTFKKPFWYGIDTLGDNIDKVRYLISELKTNCDNYIVDLQIDGSGKSIFDKADKNLKDGLENLYNSFKDETIKVTVDGGDVYIIPLYISNLGFKENNETYTGRILQDYETKFEYLIKKIFDPLYEICQDLINADNDELAELPTALDNFNNVISTLEGSMDLIAYYITKKISDEYINLKNIYYVFYIIFLTLMGVSIISMSIIFFIYYYKPISAMNYSIKLILYFINFLMIFCLVLSGLSGILYRYFSDSSDIVDCMYSSKNIGSDDPRIIERTTPSSVLTRCVRGDGNLLEEYLNDNSKKMILNLQKLNTIYKKIVEAYYRITPTEDNEYNTLSSLDQVILDFKYMQQEFSLTTSKEESGTLDINYMLNELNKYTLKGMANEPVCDVTTFDLWSLREESGPTAQIDQEGNNDNIKYKSIENPGTIPPSDYTVDCLDGFNKYYYILVDYKTENNGLLGRMLTNTGVGLTDIKQNFKTEFEDNIRSVINDIKKYIADPFWKTFGDLVNDTNDYTGIEEAEKVDILGWVNCSFLGQDYNLTMNTIKETLVPDLKVVTYCSLIFEILIIALYFIIISLANNIRDKDSEKNEFGYDVESIKEDGGEMFEIVENNKYKKNYEAEGELITVNKIKSKQKKNIHISNTESNINLRIDKTNDVTKEEDINSIKKNLPDNIIQVPKFDIAENIEAIKNVDVRKLIDKNGKAVMHPIRISINSPLGVMEASDKYAHLYNYDVFEPLKEDELDGESDIENGSYYQKNDKKKNKRKSIKKNTKKGKGKGKSNKDKESNKSDSFSF